MCHDDDDKDAKSKKDTHLSTSTITNDDQLPSDFRHFVWGEDKGYARRMGSDNGGDNDERELARWCWFGTETYDHCNLSGVVKRRAHLGKRQSV